MRTSWLKLEKRCAGMGVQYILLMYSLLFVYEYIPVYCKVGSDFLLMSRDFCKNKNYFSSMLFFVPFCFEDLRLRLKNIQWKTENVELLFCAVPAWERWRIRNRSTCCCSSVSMMSSAKSEPSNQSSETRSAKVDVFICLFDLRSAIYKFLKRKSYPYLFNADSFRIQTFFNIVDKNLIFEKKFLFFGAPEGAELQTS